MVVQTRESIPPLSLSFGSVHRRGFTAGSKGNYSQAASGTPVASTAWSTTTVVPAPFYTWMEFCVHFLMFRDKHFCE